MIVYYTDYEHHILSLYDRFIEPHFQEYEEKVTAWVEAGKPESQQEEWKKWYNELWSKISPFYEKQQKYLQRITKRHFSRLEKLLQNQRK